MTRCSDGQALPLCDTTCAGFCRQTDSQPDRQSDNGMPQQDCAVSAAHRLGSCGAAGVRLRFPDFLKHPECDVPRAAGHV